MEDQYDKLIQNVKILKMKQEEKEEKIKKLITICNNQKEDLQLNYNKISELLKELQKEVENAENKKQNLIDSISLTQSNKTIQNPDNDNDTLPYKKFYPRESHFTDLLQKANYQVIYNIVLSYLILSLALYVLKSYTIELPDQFDSKSLNDYLNGITVFLKYIIIKSIISIIIILLINLTGALGNYIIPGIILIGSIFLIFNDRFFPKQQLSFLTTIVYYWDKITYILKISAYFFEKNLFVSYKSYCNIKNITPKKEKGKTIVIKDNGLNEDISFEWKKFNLIKEIKNFCIFYYLPTFIYRDAYPKLQKNKISFWHGINVLLCLLFVYIEIQVGIIPLFKDNIPDLTIEKICYLFVSFILYSISLVFVAIFGFSHSYSNFTSDLFSFADKKFYGEFYHARTPKEFIDNIAYIYIDFCNYYIFPIVKSFILKNKNANIQNIVKNVVSMLFFSGIFDYLIFACINTNSPILSLCLVFVMAISFPISKIKNDYILLLNWMVITAGMGVILMTISSELYFTSKNSEYIVEDKGLNWFQRFLPKILQLAINRSLLKKSM